MILVTGATGFLGQYVLEELRRKGYNDVRAISSAVDLRKVKNCRKVVKYVTTVIHLAAKVGGIGSNLQSPGEFFYDNLSMGMNLIEASRREGVQKFVCVGSVCSYPESASPKAKEDELWNGYPEKTNAPYGIAKRALWAMLDAYHKQYGLRSVYPVLANLYGKGDESDHVIPDMIRKFQQANEEIVLWGSGEPTREFLHVKDAARAIVLLMERKNDPAPINVASGEEISIRDLANMISRLISFTGGVNWDDNKPNGKMRRSFDTSIIRSMGWKPTIKLEEGIKAML